MIVELLIIFTFLLSGSFFVKFLGFNGWYVPFLGYIVGVSSYVLLGLVQVLIGINTHPVVALSLIAGFTTALYVYDHYSERRIRFSLKSILLTGAVVSLLVAFLWTAQLFNWHIDSFFNMETGSVLVNNQYDASSMARVAKRLLAIPFIHGSAHIGSGEYYLRSFTPLLSLSVIASIAWIALEGLRKKVNKQILYTTITIGLLFMISINRYVFHSFYINGHLFFAALLLLIAGFSWLIATRNRRWQKNDTALLTIICLVIPALVVTRPEASIVAALAILPLLLNAKIHWKKRALPALTLGLSMVAWQGYVSYVDYSLTGSVGAQSYGLLFAGVALISTIPLLRLRVLKDRLNPLLWVTEGGLWLALLGLAILNPAVLRSAVSATYQNVVFGSWGWALILLAIIGGLLLLFTKTRDQAYLRFPFTTFIVLGFLLAYLRRTDSILEATGGYRVGNGDSFNRMLLQIVPLVVLYIIIAVASGKWRFDKKSRIVKPFLYIKQVTQKLLL